VEARKLEKLLRNTLTGRIRRFHMRASDKLRRIMKATLLQQVESHLLKLSLTGLRGEIKSRGLNARIVACIHDSIWVEAVAEEEDEVTRIMEATMTTVMRLSVPLSVNFEA